MVNVSSLNRMPTSASYARVEPAGISALARRAKARAPRGSARKRRRERSGSIGLILPGGPVPRIRVDARGKAFTPLGAAATIARFNSAEAEPGEPERAHAS